MFYFYCRAKRLLKKHPRCGVEVPQRGCLICFCAVTGFGYAALGSRFTKQQREWVIKGNQAEPPAASHIMTASDALNYV